jgi:hypothetical protein
MNIIIGSIVIIGIVSVIRTISSRYNIKLKKFKRKAV